VALLNAKRFSYSSNRHALSPGQIQHRRKVRSPHLRAHLCRARHPVGHLAIFCRVLPERIVLNGLHTTHAIDGSRIEASPLEESPSLDKSGTCSRNVASSRVSDNQAATGGLSASKLAVSGSKLFGFVPRIAQRPSRN
jgi:hypothetical protein